MSLYYALPHPLSPAPARQIPAERTRRAVGAMLVIYLMPPILVVLAIGAVAVVVERAWRMTRSGSLR